MAEESYQSLYRRYRPQRFSEVRGQEHVATALSNAVRQGRVAHAYLFSGPRGTGKTSTARILAKALNCEAPESGEPCGHCQSCSSVVQGNSLDVHELDAASSNGVEAMRDLVARAALGSPGRRKVYIVDEVHMLSTAASNTLLKTLEEPPAHVVFVLATTDPHKVLPTIRSRTQHFEFRLLSGPVLAALLRDVEADAGLGLPREALELAVRRGNGSARDALSALDQVAAAGVVDDEVAVLDDLVEAVCERDAGRALLAVAQGLESGRDPIRMASDLVEHLRQGFLATMAPGLVSLPDEARDRAAGQARRLGPAALVRAMELLGQTLVEMRDAIAPRVSLEVALVRLAQPEADDSPGALLERIERLEHRLAEGVAGREVTAARDVVMPASSTATDGPTAPASTAGPAGPKAALGALRRRSTRPAPPGQGRPSGPPPSGPPPPAGHAPTSAPAARAGQPAPSSQVGPPSPTQQVGRTAPGSRPSRDDLVQAWGDHVLGQLGPRARALFRAGRFVAIDGETAVFALPGETHRAHCERCRGDVEAALSSHFGLPVRLRLVVDDAAPPAEEDGDLPSLAEVRDLPVADPGSGSIEERILQIFPGAQEVDP